MLRRVAVLAMAAVVLLPTSTLGATHSVSVVSNAFQPAIRTVALGDTVEWTNDASVPHTTTANGSLWNEHLSPDETFPRAFQQAGRFGYFCSIHQVMQGAIKVRLRITPSSGGLDTIFTIRVAEAAAPSGFRYLIQRRKNNGDWTLWKTTTADSRTFDPRSAGTWSFRAKTQRISDGFTSGNSPRTSVTVTD